MKGVQVMDEGEYICEVETYTEPIQQKNQLSVLIPAQVEPNPQVNWINMVLYTDVYSFSQDTTWWKPELS